MPAFPSAESGCAATIPTINKRHHAKVYGKAAVGSPPMSVPHLDTRVIGGQHSLLFGPYAGFSSKFLKHGSLLDLVESISPANVKPLLSVARDNFDLTEYLVEQVLQSESHRAGGARRVLPEGGAKGLAAAGRRTARPDHQARRQARRAPGVRHRARRRVGQLAGRAARRLARRIDRGLHRDQRLAEVFCRRTDRAGVAAETEGDHPLLWHFPD